ncbi:ankyrin repeat domain-containing protein [Candidatus Micrarchaeota archaeon]|nr:ankyrin repeat domain-containing protein [Candidatus Micrarchaeota archaeon]
MSIPTISFEPRVPARRRTICKSDEAVVSRLSCKGEFERYDGMVERLQKIEYPGPHMSQSFAFRVGEGGRGDFLFEQSDRMYHILKFMALDTANALFPGHFLKAHELRVFRKGGAEYAATYSDFVRDLSGAGKRTMEARELFKNEGLRVRIAADRREHELTPELGPLMEAVAAAGIIIQHPEANYHLTENGIVFFEVDGIGLPKALDEGKRRFSKTKELDSLDKLAGMYATILKCKINGRLKKIVDRLLARHPMDSESETMLPIYEDFMQWPFDALRKEVLQIFLRGMKNRIINDDFTSVLWNMSRLPLKRIGKAYRSARDTIWMTLEGKKMALMWAALQGYTETAKMLIDKGAHANAKVAKTMGRYTALMSAASNGHTETVAMLIDKGADVNAKDNEGRTALMNAAWNGHTNTAEMLIDKGADVNANDNAGNRALMWAAYCGHTETAEMLIDKGADVNASDNYGWTALMRIAEDGQTETAEMLRKHGATE